MPEINTVIEVNVYGYALVLALATWKLTGIIIALLQKHFHFPE